MRLQEHVVPQCAKLGFPSFYGTYDTLLSYILGSTRVETVDHALIKCDLVLSEFQTRL